MPFKADPKLCFPCSAYATCPKTGYHACDDYRDWRAPLKPLMRNEKTAWDEGFMAHDAGEPLTSNPYYFSTKPALCREWRIGWNTAYVCTDNPIADSLEAPNELQKMEAFRVHSELSKKWDSLAAVICWSEESQQMISAIVDAQKVLAKLYGGG